MGKILFAVTSPVSIPLLGPLPSMLSEIGWKVHLVSSALDQGDRTNSELDHHCIDIERAPAPLADLRALIQMTILLSKLKPEIVVGATPKASFLSLTAGFLARIPTRVYFLWGLRLETTSGPYRRLLWTIERLTAKFSTHVVAVSPSLRDSYLRENLVRPQKVELVSHGSSKGVNLETFRPASQSEGPGLSEEFGAIGLVPGVPVIGFFGRLNEDKGLQALADARNILWHKQVDHQVLVVGNDETNGIFAEKLNLAGRPAVFLGGVRDLARYYRMIDVLCLPTLREGMPNVCLEAAASGVPVVVSRVTGAIDAVEEGITGLVVEAGSPESLADALQTLISQTKLRNKLATASRPWVSARFNEADVCQAYIRFFERLEKNPIDISGEFPT